MSFGIPVNIATAAAGPLTGLRAGQSSRRRLRAAGTAGPFKRLQADQEQRTPPSTPMGPQYLSRNYGQDRSAEVEDNASSHCVRFADLGLQGSMTLAEPQQQIILIDQQASTTSYYPSGYAREPQRAGLQVDCCHQEICEPACEIGEIERDH